MRTFSTKTLTVVIGIVGMAMIVMPVSFPAVAEAWTFPVPKSAEEANHERGEKQAEAQRAREAEAKKASEAQTAAERENKARQESETREQKERSEREAAEQSAAKPIVARVVGKDPSDDLAVLRISTAGLVLHPLLLGSDAKVRVGEAVWAIGNPFGYGRTLTGGIISALNRRIQAPNGATIGDALQTDAPINPGSSGGPLLNGSGEVIGINSEIVTSGGHGGNIGIAFAIPIGDAVGELVEVLNRRGQLSLCSPPLRQNRAGSC